MYREALGQFEAAIAAQPNFAPARSFKARTLLTLGDVYLTELKAARRAFEDALSSAEDAVAISPGLPDVQATLADALVTVKLDLGAASRAYAEAMKTGSGQADVLTRFGYFAARTGDVAHGVAAAKLAAVLDPLNPSAFRFLGLVLTVANDFAGAEKALRRAVSLNPAAEGVHAALGDVFYLRGQFETAKGEYNLESETWKKQKGLALALEKLKDHAGAKLALGRLKAELGELGLYQEAQIRAQSGRSDEAFKALNAAFQLKDAGLVALKTDPLLRPLQSDSRFGELLSRLNLQVSG